MNNSIQRDVILSALYLAIREREKQEKYMNYERDSCMLAELRRLQESINKGTRTIEVLG